MLLDELATKNLGIWGTGKEGQATLHWLQKHLPQQEIMIIDESKLESPSNLAPNEPNPALLEILQKVQVVIRSPGVSIYKPEILLAQQQWQVQFLSASELFFILLQEQRQIGAKTPITIGITGTKGKTTTTALTDYLLRNLGYRSTCAGNLGVPLIDLADNLTQYDYIVAELSSYQTSDLQHFPDYCILLNLYPEHEQWHLNHDNYYRDKTHLLQGKVNIILDEARCRWYVSQTWGYSPSQIWPDYDDWENATHLDQAIISNLSNESEKSQPEVTHKHDANSHNPNITTDVSSPLSITKHQLNTTIDSETVSQNLTGTPIQKQLNITVNSKVMSQLSANTSSMYTQKDDSSPQEAKTMHTDSPVVFPQTLTESSQDNIDTAEIFHQNQNTGNTQLTADSFSIAKTTVGAYSSSLNNQKPTAISPTSTTHKNESAFYQDDIPIEIIDSLFSSETENYTDLQHTSAETIGILPLLSTDDPEESDQTSLDDEYDDIFLPSISDDEQETTFSEESDYDEESLDFADDTESQILLFQTPNGYHYVETDKKIYYRNIPKFDVTELQLLGRGNYTNLGAVFTLLDCLQLPTDQHVWQLVTQFQPIAHRLQLVAQVDNLRFIDDSISTIPEATLVALDTFKEDRVIPLLGGFDRHQDYHELTQFLEQSANISEVILMGATGQRLLDNLQAMPLPHHITPHLVENLETALQIVKQLCQNDPQTPTVILLSPAAPSYDMYRNFEERGDRFTHLVQQLWSIK